MDVTDQFLSMHRDWDPLYLQSIFNVDFYDFTELWSGNIKDVELVKAVDDVEKYCPIVEDISMDDIELCNAVEQIEEE